MPIYEQIQTRGVPVKVFTDELDEKAREQLVQLAESGIAVGWRQFRTQDNLQQALFINCKVLVSNEKEVVLELGDVKKKRKISIHS
jgi:hypothetical protein